MGHFMGTVKGSRGEASRLGTAKSGLTTTCNGWGLGATVRMWQQNGEDVVSVEIDEGSGYNAGRSVCIGVFTKADFERVLKEKEAERLVRMAAER